MKDYLTIGSEAALGFGLMRLPDEKTTCKMVDTYLDSGYNYFDTAYIYAGSEEKVNTALTKRHPRESFVVANKIPPWMVNNHDECDNLFKEQLKRTGLDYFDYYLVHSLDDSREQSFEDLKIFEWAFDLKKKGLAKHIGFSFHGSTAYLARVLERHPQVEFVQLQLNYMDILRGPAGEWQDLAIKHNIPIIVMEPVRGGALAKLPATAEKILKDYAPNRSIASWAMQYAGTLQGVTCVLGGMSNVDQMNDNLLTFKNLKPLTAEEMNLLEAAISETAKLSSIPCTACKYCHADCPQEINIASCFSFYNELKRGGSDWNLSMLHRTLPEGKRANDCVDCGVCLNHCPQHINIPKELRTVAEALK